MRGKSSATSQVALSMREVLKALNQIVEDGVIEAYAIGGAIGAAFYIQAAQTEDVDAFMFIPASSTGLVSPVYQALTALGGVIEGEYVRFGEWPLQVLTDANPLIAEAIRNARLSEFDGISTRVFRPEYLCAIALQVGRAKDQLRVKMFLEHNAVNREELSRLSARFGLSQRLTAGEEPQ